MHSSKAKQLLKAYDAIAQGRVVAAKENECDRCSDITDLYIDNVSDILPSYVCLNCWAAMANDARYDSRIR